MCVAGGSRDLGEVGAGQCYGNHRRRIASNRLKLGSTQPVRVTLSASRLNTAEEGGRRTSRIARSKARFGSAGLISSSVHNAWLRNQARRLGVFPAHPIAVSTCGDALQTQISTSGSITTHAARVPHPGRSKVSTSRSRSRGSVVGAPSQARDREPPSSPAIAGVLFREPHP